MQCWKNASAATLISFLNIVFMHICYTYTFQIMKLILILDKENQTKHTVRILNDDFVY